MLREVSSMNSTRTWVTPPREPEAQKKSHVSIVFALRISLSHPRILPVALAAQIGTQKAFVGISNLWSISSGRARTGAAEDTGHLDELDGLLAGIHLEGEDVELGRRGW